MSCTAVGENGVTYIETARCTGHCCERFYIPHTPDELRAKAEDGSLKDGATIADMVIDLGPAGRGDGSEGDYKGHFYTCRHFDRETRDCRIYNSRPGMCSKYPYGKPCTYDECTMKLCEQVPGLEAEVVS